MINKNKKITLCVLAILAIALVVLGFIWVNIARESITGHTIYNREPITIIHQTWVGDGLIHLANEKGFFNDVEVEILRVEGAAERRALLASGGADISLETIDMSVVDIGVGTPEVMVLMLDVSLGADGIIATKDIQSIEDLKGKKIGCSVGDPPYFLLRILMEKRGIKLEDIQILDIQAAEAGAAFVHGDIDAACTWEPWLSKANERKGGHILISSADLPGTIVDVMVVRPEVLQNRRNAVKTIMKAWLKAYDYSKEHPKESYEIMGKAFDLNEGEFEEFIQGIKWNDLKENKEFFESQIFEVTSEINEVAYKDGMISNKINVNEVIDASLIREI